MMFNWERDMVRFMRDASEYSDYYSRMAEFIKEKISPTDSLCDAGCGLGYFAKAVAPYCKSITAMDISPNAIAVAQELAKNTPNMQAFVADVESYTPEEKFDVVTYGFFGRNDEILRFAKRTCKGKAIVIKRNWKNHRFSIGEKPMQHNTLPEMEQCLNELGIPYKKETLLLEFGQPFRSEEDAVKFFRIYSRDENPESITFEDIAQRITEINDGVYKLYLPQQKNLGILTFDIDRIPREI